MNLKSTKNCLFAAFIVAVTLSGCATYRTDSNITAAPTSALPSNTNILILEGVPEGKYKEIGPVEVSVKKLTVFHKDPTKEQANAALVEKARIIGADAVIKVTYESGIGLTTWGYIDAKGIGVKLDDASLSVQKIATPPTSPIVGVPSQNKSAADKLRELNQLYKDGVINQEDFETKKKEILDSM